MLRGRFQAERDPGVAAWGPVSLSCSLLASFSCRLSLRGGSGSGSRQQQLAGPGSARMPEPSPVQRR